MKSFKENKGITLIALIITIIVMLILVGVTVSVVLNGGLFSKAKTAASDTQREADYEMLLSAVIGAINNDGKVDFDKLDRNLPSGFTGDNGMYSSKSGNSFIVYEDGTVIAEVEKIVKASDEEYEYWKTDGEGTILYCSIPEGVEAPKKIVVPCKIIHQDGTEEVITKIGDAALCGCEVERNEDGRAIFEEDSEEPEYIADSDDELIFNKLADVKEIIISKGIEEIGLSAMLFDEDCVNIVLPSTLTTIKLMAFGCCTSLKSIIIPGGVETIGAASFDSCESLEKVTILEGVKEIGASAFNCCTSLKKITIPEGVITIGEGAFQDCTYIAEITIPSTVDNMGSYPFRGWINKQKIHIKGRTEIPADSDGDSYSNIGWNANWFEACNAVQDFVN